MQSGTLAAALQEGWQAGGVFNVQLHLSKRVPLEGDELLAWQESHTAQVIEEEGSGDVAPELPTRCLCCPFITPALELGCHRGI
jgi:hypothetical protein